MIYSQPGIFNALDYGMSPANSGSANATALQNAINAAQGSMNPNGAIVLIPSFDGATPPNYGPYKIAVTPSAPAIFVPKTGGAFTPLLICGTGSGTTLLVEPNDVIGTATLFSVTDTGNAVTFQDLTITCAVTAATSPVLAFDLEDAFGSSFFRVNVIDCAQAFLIRASSTTLLQCSITYDPAYPAGSSCTGISILERLPSHDPVTQVNIEQCFLTCANVNDSATGIVVDFSDWARVTDTQISGFYTGIIVKCTETGTTTGPTFAALDVDARGSCVVIESSVYDVSFVNCHFGPTPGASPPASGIVQSPGSAGNGAIDTVRFTSCAVVGYPAPYYGLEIDGGQNIQITGGDYSGNGGGGIAILGDATEIQINGANCVGLSYAGAPTPTTQLYGIYATAGQDIQIVGVNCSGNGVSSEDLGAGIYLDAGSVGGVSDVKIVGAICSGPSLGATTSVQQYGIFAKNVVGLLIGGCSLTNNTAYGAYLYGVQNVTVTACDVYSSTSGSIGIAVEASDPFFTSDVFIRNCNGAQYGPNYAKVVNVSGDEVSFVRVTNCAGYK